MKPELSFVLEEAGWPALLVEADGTIRRANQLALSTFGLRRDELGSLGTVWTKDNGIQPAEFLREAAARLQGPSRATLVTANGSRFAFEVFVTRVSRGGEQYFLCQIFEAKGPPPVQGDTTAFLRTLAPAPPPPPTSTETLPAAAPVAAGGSVDAEVAQKQKLECALQLIRTVVLDFNNALTSILGHSSLILSKMPPDHPWRNSLIEVEKSAERAAEVAQDLASFSRQEKDARAHATGNLNDLIQRTAALFRSSAPPGVQIVVSLERQVYAVKFEEAKMQQAILKVLDNAVQAIAANGQITVRTKNVDASEAFQDGSTRLPAGYYVSVEISDNGCGIPPDVQPRIFEPFFTTKGGQHRGLGLAWVYGIVTNHGGSVTVSSKPGDGTSVRLYLPAQKKFVKDRFGKQEDLMGHQTILMVDDEDMVLTMGETILSAFGYRVMTASSGPEALDLFAKHGAGIDLVITDMVMPQMSGRELVERLKSLNPALRIVCSSGYLRNVIEGESANYLKKPFTSQDLLRKVKQALE